MLPDIVVGFSLRALVQGTLAPSSIEVFGARLRLVRGEDGKFQLGARPDLGADSGAGPAGESDFSQVLPAVIEQLESKPDPNRPLSFLTKLRILDGQITIEDRQSQLSWEAPGAVIELRRGETGITGEVGLAVNIRGTRATVTADFTYDSTNSLVKMQGGAVNLHPAALAWLAPQLQALNGLTTPLDVSLTASGRADGTIESLRFDLRGGQGQLTVIDRFAEPLQIAQLRLRGDFDRSEQRLTLETGELKLGSSEKPGPEITITGSVVGAEDESSDDLDVELAVSDTSPTAVRVMLDLNLNPNGQDQVLVDWTLFEPNETRQFEIDLTTLESGYYLYYLEVADPVEVIAHYLPEGVLNPSLARAFWIRDRRIGVVVLAPGEAAQARGEAGPDQEVDRGAHEKEGDVEVRRLGLDQGVLGDDLRIGPDVDFPHAEDYRDEQRSEERRVGKECRSRWSPER